jgi:hypothetical protein
MVFFRFLVYFLLILLGSSLALYFFTRNRRYLAFAWQLTKFILVFGVILGGLFVLERFVLV